jgi:hypothetical protein
MQWYLFILNVLSVWRITHLLQAEDGPFDIVFYVRKKAGAGFFGSLLDCFYCLSIWVALPFAIWSGSDIKEIILLWLSFSAAAILLEKISSRTEKNS